jgi:putative membrane protein
MRRKPAAIIALLGGLVLLIVLLRAYHWKEILVAVLSAGWAIAWICLWRFITIFTDTLGWRSLFPIGEKPAIVPLIVARWIGEAVNSLLPVAQVGGDVVRARLAWRLSGGASTAAAATVVDFTAGLAAQILYTILGVAALLSIGLPRQHPLLRSIAIATFLVAVGTVAFAVAQRRGLLSIGAAGLRRALGARLGNRGHELIAGAASFDSKIREIYSQKAAVRACLFWRTATWLLHTAETWIVLRYLLGNATWAEALALESLGTAVRSAAFFLPAGVGVQEGGFVWIGNALGLLPATALALSLLKRGREILVGIPALALWAWWEKKPPVPN